MHVQFDGMLTSIKTKRARRDRENVVVEEPALAITVDVPVSALSPSALGSLLRAMDRSMTVEMFDGQLGFDVAERDGKRELVPESIR